MERGKHRSTSRSTHLTNIIFQRNDINPCNYKRFCDNLDLEQHGDDFLVCGLTSNLECLADEFKNHFLVKKAEIVLSNVEFLWMILGGMSSWIKRT